MLHILVALNAPEAPGVEHGSGDPDALARHLVAAPGAAVALLAVVFLTQRHAVQGVVSTGYHFVADGALFRLQLEQEIEL